MTVTVVGAGIVGCAIAYELAARGADVRLIDPRGAGQGASRASAGMLAPRIEGHSVALLQLGLASLDLYDNFVARVVADSQRRVEYRRTGTLQVALTDDEARRLEEQHHALTRAAVAHSWLDAAAVRRLEPSLTDAVVAGLLIPGHGYVGVATLISALSDAAGRLGASLSSTEVREVSSASGGVRIDTSDGALTSDVVVLAAGSWSGGIPMGSTPSPPVRPVRGQLLQLRFERPPLSHVVWGGLGYLVPWEDGRLLVGATVEDVGFDEGVTIDGLQQLLACAQTLLPAAESARCDGARAGLRPATPDELPIIGASSTMPGVYYATGHYRNGVLLAPLTAVMIAELVLDGRERAESVLVQPARFGL
ncbi:MAG: glycine oxidase ThiO [Acidobacteria bacterium]|nr:glycine oxidase ThiO [Acidobacteriota bacterium]